VVSPKECHGWLEKTTMGTFRDTAFRRLLEADAHKRLRLVYPAASRSSDVATFIHSKVMVVDGELARVGSANFSHRSMGMDTECDLTVDADGDARVQAGVRRIIDRLLAEHLGRPVDTVRRDIDRLGSMRALIDACGGADHTLVRMELSGQPEPPSEVLRAAADPDEPAAFGPPVDALVPAVDAASARSPLRLWILPAVVLVAAFAVASRTSHTLDSIPAAPSSLWIGVGVFVLAGLLLTPLELLAIAAGVFFGAVRGGLVALAGSLVAAIIGYVAGRAIGADGLKRWMSRRSYRSVRQVSAHGVAGVIFVRFATVASAGSIHLACGAGRIPFGIYMTGTTIALAPAVWVLSGLGGLLRQTLLNPTPANGLRTIAGAVLLLAAASGIRTLLLIRQFAPAMSGHRGRAEFG
jgi:uncharacterized membrane protein YdjX (TVP38/TMEM64 family)